MSNMEINFTQIEFTKEDREELGGDLTAALLTLGLFAEELMQFQHLLLMSLHPWPDDSVFKKASSSRSHALVRILNLKVVEAKYAFKGFATSVAMQKKAKNE
ncbi:hypothetical protein [Cognatishimia maritima]|uniref:hypothetical protein n=1 Tax=Cognatishimia maritima TaxID=870908 RepID=UPI0010426E82|nr:hypothetical protein [Cognatishimia maritima]